MRAPTLRKITVKLLSRCFPIGETPTFGAKTIELRVLKL